MKQKVIIVDKDGQEIGTEEKLKAHQDGRLHRAFSVLVFNARGELMLQQRQKTKYHCGGLWANTCCSHPRPGESLEHATRRRLKEEMGFICDLRERFSFIYKARFDNRLTEHEFDHVFTGWYNRYPILNPKEAMDWKWMGLEELESELKNNPEIYTPWLKIIIKDHGKNWLRKVGMKNEM